MSAIRLGGYYKFRSICSYIYLSNKKYYTNYEASEVVTFTYSLSRILEKFHGKK